jgi:hypothetical protein
MSIFALNLADRRDADPHGCLPSDPKMGIVSLAFDSDGLLPPGPQSATVAEVEEVLVTGFAGSSTRRVIFDLWLEHRRAISDVVSLGRQWLDGSFATAKLDPRDADVVTFLDHVAVDALPGHRQILLSGLFEAPWIFWRLPNQVLSWGKEML